jgi:hypothetical protein
MIPQAAQLAARLYGRDARVPTPRTSRPLGNDVDSERLAGVNPIRELASARKLTTEQEGVKASGPGAQNTSAYLETEEHTHENSARRTAIRQQEAAHRFLCA